MTDTTSFLSAELTEMGLMAAADPQFAERLLKALQDRCAERASESSALTPVMGLQPSIEVEPHIVLGQ